MDRAESEFQRVGRTVVMGTVNMTRAQMRQRWRYWDDALERHYARMRRKLGYFD